jgi:hypothetical protein
MAACAPSTTTQRREDDVTIEVIRSRATTWPTFKHHVFVRARRALQRLVERDWRQFPISIGRWLIRPFPDRVYLTLGHLFYFGRWPHYRRPQTFNEHIQEYMLRCRDPLLQIAADKVASRAYIARRVGAHYLVPLLGVWDDADEVPLATLPRPCVIKPSAASGWVLLLKSDDSRPEEELREIMRKWLRRDYSRLHREWCYRGLPRRIVAEPMLLDAVTQQPPTDYKGYVIGGALRYFHVDRDRFTHHTRNLYSADWKLLPLRWTLENHPPEPAPAPLDEMVRVAEELARPFEFLRVDLYVVEGKVYVGELTNYPGAGFEKFIPGRYAKVIGSLWKRRCPAG